MLVPMVTYFGKARCLHGLRYRRHGAELYQYYAEDAQINLELKSIIMEEF